MELIERDNYLATLQTAFQEIEAGEGHCVFIGGEAGMGKTSLVKAFCQRVKKRVNIYKGTCDALFTPRPLAPLYDILLQLRNSVPETSTTIKDRTSFFTQVFYELKNEKELSILIFEDIHWADEATLDFIKFLARRITQLRCLFILTYRDNEVHLNHPLRNVLGQLNTGSVTRFQLLPLSKTAVEKMAEEKGYRGEDVYSISGGNPFYVTEILASYSRGVPDNIKDSILSSYNRLNDETKQVWQILSVLPTGCELSYLQKIDPLCAASIQNCLDFHILIPRDGLIFFKHELFRRTIETSLSPILRISLNKRILELFRESFEKNGEIERIIHHAKNANEFELVTHYAPIAARQAAEVGAHMEAAKLYVTAIEYYQGNDSDTLLRLYEPYAYQCYLTYQIREAIIYTSKSLQLLKETGNAEKLGHALRFLSRLWWIEGNRKKAELFANQAIDMLQDRPSSKEKAMAFSNMSQLKMLSEEIDESLAWGEQAITMAKEINDKEVLAHALNNMGTVLMWAPASRQEGVLFLEQSLEISLKHGLDEHSFRAYANLACNAIRAKDYACAKQMLDQGIRHCEEKAIAMAYLLFCRARLKFETGNWSEALDIAGKLIQDEPGPAIVKIGALIIVASIKIRKGEMDVFPLLAEARTKAFLTEEPQRIVPLMTALLEYEWLSGKIIIEQHELDYTIEMVGRTGNEFDNLEFAFWLFKTRKQQLTLQDAHELYQLDNRAAVVKAAGLWAQLGCPYQQALCLFEGNDGDKRKAIGIVDQLGATAVFEKMKFIMRASGIRQLPRGLRKTTRANVANLTQREMDILLLLKESLQNKEIGERLFISPKTVDHHISSILFKLDVNSRSKAVQEALQLEIIK